MAKAAAERRMGNGVALCAVRGDRCLEDTHSLRVSNPGDFTPSTMNERFDAAECRSGVPSRSRYPTSAADMQRNQLPLSQQNSSRLAFLGATANATFAHCKSFCMPRTRTADSFHICHEHLDAAYSV